MIMTINYPLVVTNIAMVKPWPIEIDGLPNLKMVDLSMAMLNNQMVDGNILLYFSGKSRNIFLGK